MKNIELCKTIFRIDNINVELNETSEARSHSIGVLQGSIELNINTMVVQENEIHRLQIVNGTLHTQLELTSIGLATANTKLEFIRYIQQF